MMRLSSYDLAAVAALREHLRDRGNEVAAQLKRRGDAPLSHSEAFFVLLLHAAVSSLEALEDQAALSEAVSGQRSAFSNQRSAYGADC